MWYSVIKSGQWHVACDWIEWILQFSFVYNGFMCSFRSVTSGLWDAQLCLSREPRGCFHSECWTGGEGESVAALRVNRFRAPTHQRPTRGWSNCKHHFSGLRYNRQGTESSQPDLVEHVLPTVPLSQFRLGIMTQNKILVRFHYYLVLEKVQWRLLVVNRFLKI